MANHAIPPQVTQDIHKTTKHTLWLFLFAFAVLASLVLLLYTNMAQKEENDNWVEHTHEVIETLTRLQVHIRDMETGQLNFLVTGQTQYLKPYSSIKAQLWQDLGTLQNLTKDNPKQQANIRKVRALISTRLNRLNQLNSLKSEAARDFALEVMQNGQGSLVIQKLRLLSQEMETLERKLLQARIQRDRASESRVKLAFLAGFLAILGLVVGALYLINKEMTERKQAHHDLQELNRNLEQLVAERTSELEFAQQKSEALAAERTAILNQLVEGVIVTDESGQVIFINDSAVQLHGGAKLNIPTEHYSQHYNLLTEDGHPYPAQHLPLARAVLKDEVILNERWKIRRTDGSEVLAIGSARPLYSTHQSKIGAVLTIRDDTARAAAEKALRNSEEQFRTLAESIPQLAWMAEPDGSRFWYNQRWYSYTGASPDAMKGWGWTNVHHPDHVEGVIERIKSAFQNGYPWEDTFPLRNRDGEYRWFLSRAVPVHDEDGRIIRWFGSNTDITEQIEIQQALAASEESIRKLNEELEQRVEQRTAQLVAINHELESFSYSVSHDLRAPLRSIDGFSQALAEDYGALFDDVGKDYLQRVRKESQRMGRLIDDMLKLSRLTRGELQKDSVNLSDMVREIINDLRAQNPERKTVTVHIEPDLTAEADERLIRAVLDNLIGNAWKFTSHHTTALIEFGSMHKENGRVFYVRDDGAGFNMAYVDKLFGAFQRLHAMNEFSGTGIGLATVQRIIHRHGGKVWAEGEIENGATFYFTL